VEALAFPNITQQSENCLSINVQVPEGTKPGDNLPVLMWQELFPETQLASETFGVLECYFCYSVWLWRTKAFFQFE
jgi:hypothetical protein